VHDECQTDGEKDIANVKRVPAMAEYATSYKLAGIYLAISSATLNVLVANRDNSEPLSEQRNADSSDVECKIQGRKIHGIRRGAEIYRR